MGKATKYNPSFRLKGRRLLSGCLILVGIALSLAACGKDGAQESGRGEQAQGASANLDSNLAQLQNLKQTRLSGRMRRTAP